ncbi:MAG: sulfotransferase [Lewinellaceae bacterium]|nr:sulfotransferase [Lewinellaceae bacterium]
MEISNFIIITGHRKSGTSVFQRLFDSHPGIFLYPVDISILYAYFPFFSKELKDNEDSLRDRLELVICRSLQLCEKELAKNAIDINSFAKKVSTQLSHDDLLKKNKVIKTMAQTWVEMFYKSNENRPFIFKETSQVIHFNAFKSELPGFKMVNLIRDPRDNYAALKSGVKNYYSKMDENEMETLASLINRGRMDLKAAFINESLYPDNFRALKFEELASNTEEEMQKIANFIEIRYDPILSKPTLFNQKYSGNSHDGLKFKGLERTNVSKWKERISDFEAKVIEFWLGDVMKTWGYQLEFAPDSAQIAFSEFYEWYNTRYFYRDSFSNYPSPFL